MQFVINVNLMGVLYCTKQAIKLMKENGLEGYIVNINRYLSGLNFLLLSKCKIVENPLSKS